MEKFISKGYDLITRKDGSQSYKPFAIYQAESTKIKYYISLYSSGYDLSQYGFITRDNYKEALDMLDKVIKEKNERDKKMEDQQIIKTEEVII